MGYGITVRIKGPCACFTRPELHTERTSYDVITPSAARGILEACYWKPAIRWIIDGITVLNPIKFESIRRNEVGDKASFDNAKSVMGKGSGVLGISATEKRQQRNTLYLTDVDYLVEAHFELTDQAEADDTPEKHYNIALRRLRKGQCFSAPYLGCREFAADVHLIENGDVVPTSYYAAEENHDLGYMLYDLDFSDPDRPEPLFFRAAMVYGRIDVAGAEVIK